MHAQRSAPARFEAGKTGREQQSRGGKRAGAARSAAQLQPAADRGAPKQPEDSSDGERAAAGCLSRRPSAGSGPACPECGGQVDPRASAPELTLQHLQQQAARRRADAQERTASRIGRGGASRGGAALRGAASGKGAKRARRACERDGSSSASDSWGANGSDYSGSEWGGHGRGRGRSAGAGRRGGRRGAAAAAAGPDVRRSGRARKPSAVTRAASQSPPPGDSLRPPRAARGVRPPVARVGGISRGGGTFLCGACLRKAALQAVEEPCGATLVIVPPSILPQWWAELHRHTAPGRLRIAVYAGQVREGEAGAAKAASRLLRALLRIHAVVRRTEWAWALCGSRHSLC